MRLITSERRRNFPKDLGDRYTHRWLFEKCPGLSPLKIPKIKK